MTKKAQREWKPGVPLYECSDGTTTIDKRIYDAHEAAYARAHPKQVRRASVPSDTKAGQESGTTPESRQED